MEDKGIVDVDVNVVVVVVVLLLCSTTGSSRLYAFITMIPGVFRLCTHYYRSNESRMVPVVELQYFLIIILY
jgi:hypothetical protein